MLLRFCSGMIFDGVSSMRGWGSRYGAKAQGATPG